MTIHDEIEAELARALAKYPDCESLPNGTGASGYKTFEVIAKQACERAYREGRCTHAHIFEEEAAEVLAAEDPAAIRKELVQVAAMAVKWIRDIDRKASTDCHGTTPEVPTVVRSGAVDGAEATDPGNGQRNTADPSASGNPPTYHPPESPRRDDNEKGPAAEKASDGSGAGGQPGVPAGYRLGDGWRVNERGAYEHSEPRARLVARVEDAIAVGALVPVPVPVPPPVGAPPGFRVVGRSGKDVPWEGRKIRFARIKSGAPADGEVYTPGGGPTSNGRGWPLHPEWEDGQYDILEPIPVAPVAPFPQNGGVCQAAEPLSSSSADVKQAAAPVEAPAHDVWCERTVRPCYCAARRARGFLPTPECGVECSHAGKCGHKMPSPVEAPAVPPVCEHGCQTTDCAVDCDDNCRAAGEAHRQYMVLNPPPREVPPGPVPPERRCEFCGCRTNARLRACCNRGSDADGGRAMEGDEAEERCPRCRHSLSACDCCPECNGEGDFLPAGACGACEFCPSPRPCGACNGIGKGGAAPPAAPAKVPLLSDELRAFSATTALFADKAAVLESQLAAAQRSLADSRAETDRVHAASREQLREAAGKLQEAIERATAAERDVGAADDAIQGLIVQRDELRAELASLRAKLEEAEKGRGLAFADNRRLRAESDEHFAHGWTEGAKATRNRMAAVHDRYGLFRMVETALPPPPEVPTAPAEIITLDGKPVRPCVVAFARDMEQKLRENDYKGGWQDDTWNSLLERMKEETAELETALRDSNWAAMERRKEARGRVRGEAADVANFAMMLAENEGVPPEVPTETKGGE